MRSLTVWIDCPVVAGREMIMVMPERDLVSGPPTMQGIREGILMGKVEDAIELYLVHLMARQTADEYPDGES